MYRNKLFCMKEEALGTNFQIFLSNIFENGKKNMSRNSAVACILLTLPLETAPFR